MIHDPRFNVPLCAQAQDFLNAFEIQETRHQEP